MAKLSTQELIDAIKELTVLELNDLVKACEEEFGVSAAAGSALSILLQVPMPVKEKFAMMRKRYE